MYRSPRIAALVAALTLTAAAAGAQSVAAPKGAEIDAKLQTTLSSKTNHDGDPFTLTEYDSFFHRHAGLNGAVIEGHLEHVTAAGPTHKATLNLIFDDIKFPDGSTKPISVKVISVSEFEPKTHHIRDVGLIVGGAVAGHMTHMGGGTVAGAAAGFVLASSLKSDITVKPGSVVKLRALADITGPGTT